jgi:hypothetical protein
MKTVNKIEIHARDNECGIFDAPEVTVIVPSMHVSCAAEIEQRIADLQRALVIAREEARRVGAEF